MGGGKDLLDPRLSGAFSGQRVEGEFGVAGDNGEQIVEVMGNASSQAADCIHFLGLQQLWFPAQPFGEIPSVRDKVGDATFGVPDRADTLINVVHLAILLAIYD